MSEDSSVAPVCQDIAAVTLASGHDDVHGSEGEPRNTTRPLARLRL